MKRKRYDLDEKVFNLIKKTIASLTIEESGISIYNENGKIFIYKNCLLDETKPLFVYLDTDSNLNSTYEFSKEVSKKVREVIFEVYDTIDVEWKNEASVVEAYLKKEEELSIKRESDEFLEYLEREIFRVIETGGDSIIYTTKRTDYILPLKNPAGFGVNDLTPKVYNAYVSLLAKYKEKFVVNLKSVYNLEVEFIYNV